MCFVDGGDLSVKNGEVLGRVSEFGYSKSRFDRDDIYPEIILELGSATGICVNLAHPCSPALLNASSSVKRCESHSKAICRPRSCRLAVAPTYIAHRPCQFVANPGRYKLPDMQRDFAEGRGGIGLSNDQLARWFAYLMHTFTCDHSTAENDPDLPSQLKALTPGSQRFKRAHFAQAYAKKHAQELGLPFNWILVEIEAVGHDGAAMSRAAAAFWFENGIPSTDQLVFDEAAQL